MGRPSKKPVASTEQIRAEFDRGATRKELLKRYRTTAVNVALRGYRRNTQAVNANTSIALAPESMPAPVTVQTPGDAFNALADQLQELEPNIASANVQITWNGQRVITFEMQRIETLSGKFETANVPF